LSERAGGGAHVFQLTFSDYLNGRAIAELWIHADGQARIVASASTGWSISNTS
jgi:hypothetical protein